MKGIYSKIYLVPLVLLLVAVIAVKLHSLRKYPAISDWNYNQIKNIERVQTPFSFAVFGDNKNSITTFNNLIKRLNTEDILFALDIGDLVEDGEREKFRFFINQIRKLNTPLLTAIGNHELREGGRANYYDIFGRFYYSFTVGDAFFIVLDDAGEHRIDPWQMQWLRDELEKSLRYKYRFVFMHVPLYDPRKSGFRIAHNLKDTRFVRKLNDLFDRYNITMLFASHIHAYYRGLWGKTPYIITGGAGAELVGTNPEHDFYHYIKVNINDKGVNYEVRKIKSPDFVLIDRLIHDAWLYIYSFLALHYLNIILVIILVYLLLSIREFRKGRVRG
jgi:3',5'-cyclic AMP phosphodiesterase CpdA